MEKGKKRKRDADYPRIAYHTSTRTFDRLFKEDTLSEMKEVARRKLGLDPNMPIAFAQIREDKTVDLEDDDDFDAFYSLAHSTNFVNVKVIIGSLENEPTIATASPMTPPKKQKRKRKDRTSPGLPLETDGGQVADDECEVPEVNHTRAAVGAPQVLSDAAAIREPRKKKRKANTADSVGDDIPSRNSGIPTDTALPMASVVSSNTGLSQSVGGNVASMPAHISTPTTDQPGAKIKNARKKGKQKEQVAEPPTAAPLIAEPVRSTEKKSKKKSKTKDTSNSPVVNFAEQLAGVISETSAANGLVIEDSTEAHEAPQERKKKPKKRHSLSNQKLETSQLNSTIESVTVGGGMGPEDSEVMVANMVAANGDDRTAPSARDKNRQPKRRKSTTSDERKAAEADVDAVISKILAAKRAALVVSATVGPPAPGTAAVPAQKVEKKKKAKAIPPSGLEHLHAQADSDQHRALSQKADRSESPSSLEMQTPPLSSEPSAESTCPLCLLSPLHDRRACPLVLAGPESLERRLSELQEHSTDMFDNQTDMIVELQQLVARARNGDKKGSESSGRSQRSSPQTQGSPLNARDATPEFSPNVVKEKNVVPSPLKAKAAMQNGDTNDTSSDDTSSDDNPIDTGSILPVSKDVSLVDINLDDLIRGPNIPVLRAADIPSPDSSEDEPDEVLEEDEDQPPRRSQKTGMLDSSDEDDSGVEEDVSTEGGHHDPRTTDDPKPDLLLDSGTDHLSFQAVDQRGESQHVDTSADAAFSAVLAADTAVFRLAYGSQGSASSSQIPRTTSGVDPTSTQVTPVPPSLETLVNTPPSATTTIPIERPASQLPGSPPMKSIANPTPESDHPKEAKSAGIVQRMKTRSTKSITNSSKTRDTQNATQTPRARFAEPSQEVPDSAARRTRAATRRQTLGTVTPSILPANLGRQSRLIRVSGPAQSIEDSNGVAAPSSNSQEAMSLDTWATLKPSSPDVESTMMVDELEPSSPPLSTCMDVDNPKRNGASQDGPAKNPLFILTESQPPFPYSQWNEVSQQEVEIDQISNESEDENEVEASVQQTQPKPSQALKYRRLTDITSDHGLFSTPTSLHPSRVSSAGHQKGTDMYGRAGEEEIESESDDDSDDSDLQEQSHIPKSRRAGVTQSKRK